MSYFSNILAHHDSVGLLWLLALTATKATLLLAFAALLCLVFRRFSAATRHLIWSSALCGSLLLPFLSFMKVWELPVLPARIFASGAFGSKELAANDKALEISAAQREQGLSVSSEEGAGVRQMAEFQVNTQALQGLDTSEPGAAREKEAASPLEQLCNFVLAAWAIGVMLLLFRLMVGLVATRSLARRAVEFAGPSSDRLFSSLRDEINLRANVRLLRSEHTSMPIVCGVLRPAILLPAEAESWPDERRRMVLLHELTHVARRDCLTQMMAQAACTVYWFNPFVWSAARRLRVEREKACDDYVLSIGTRPSDYAHHLLEIARSMRERSVFTWSQTVSVAMARRSQLEGRLLAILSKEKRRGAVSRTTNLGLVALTAILLLSLGALRPTLINARNSQTYEASNGENETLETPLLDSSSIDSERGTDAAARAARMSEAFRAEEVASAASVNPQEQALNNRQAGGAPEQNVKRDGEPVAEQNIVEVIAQRSITTTVQAPDARPQASPAVKPFINTGYEQERGSGARSGAVDFIDEMAAAGYTNLSIDELVKLKTAGITADYVQSLRALGFANLTTKELTSLGISGVTPAYIKSIRAAGYNDLSAKELTSFRIHGVTPEYIKALRGAGYADLPAKQLIDFAVQGVTPSFINGIAAAGYSRLSPRELVSLRVFGVTPEFIRKARARLGELTIKQLVSLKNAGIMEEDNDREKE